MFLKKQLAVITIALFSLLFSGALFAANEDDLFRAVDQNKINEISKLLKEGADANKLLEIITNQQWKNSQNVYYTLNLSNQGDLLMLALEHGAKFSAIDMHFQRLPSIKAAEVMLKNQLNTLGPDKFLNLVMWASYDKYNPNTYAYEISQEFISLQYKLVELALKNNADPQKMDRFQYNYIPSQELSNLLLKNKEKPLYLDKFLYLVLSSSCTKWNSEKRSYEIDDELINRRNKLLKSIINNPADANALLEITINQQWNNISDKMYHSFHLLGQADLVMLAIECGAKFANIAITNSALPAYEAAKLMLENEFTPKNTVDPNKFLDWIVRASCEKYNSDTGKYEVDQELVNLQCELVELALRNNADPQKIAALNSLPSHKMAELLLKDKAFADKFFNLVLQVSCKAYNSIKKSNEIDEGLVKRKHALLELALSKGSDVQKINKSYPDADLCKNDIISLLIKNGLKSEYALELALSCIGKKDVNLDQLQKSIEIILQDGVDLDQIKSPEAVDALRRGEKFTGRGQGVLLNQLGSFYNKLSITPSTIPETTVGATTLARKYKESHGHCMGLSTLWLYAKWLQFIEPGNANGYNSDWFKNTTKAISAQSDKKDLNNEEILDIQRFAAIIDHFQNPVLDLAQGDTEQSFKLSMLNTHGKRLERKYTIASVFNLDSLHNLLKEIVYNDELIFVMHPSHATALFKHNENYYFYDPNDSKGEYKYASIEEVAKIILAASASLPESKNALGFIIIGDPDEKAHKYPKQNDFLEKNNASIDKDAAINAVHVAISMGCMESLKFFLDHGIAINQDKIHDYSLFATAVMLKQATAIAELLNRGANPNQITKYEDESSFENQKYETTALNFVSIKGCIKIAAILLADKRTNINLANESDGKTPLMLAAENGHSEIVKLYIKKGADLNQKDKNGKTALMLVQEKGIYQVIENLLKEGRSVSDFHPEL